MEYTRNNDKICINQIYEYLKTFFINFVIPSIVGNKYFFKSFIQFGGESLKVVR